MDTPAKTFVLKGTAVSPGVVIGKAYLFDRLDAQISFYKLSDPSLVNKEIKRLRTAVRESEKQLLEIKERLGHLKVTEPLYIIDVHLMILKDRKFISRTIRHIRNMSVNAEWAVRMTVDKYREVFDKFDDEYLKERFSDIRYAGQMILRNLGGEQHQVISDVDDGVIIISSDLSPTDTAKLKIDKVLGFATDIGGKTSHTAIVARSLEIPAVVGLESITRRVRTNDNIIIDGSAGLVIVNPDPEMTRRYEDKKRHYEEARAITLKGAKRPAITQDGHPVLIGGNIEFIEEIPSAITHGADGIGLYRTEFLYINRENMPTEEEHFDNYRQVVEKKKLGWSTLRTFDLGGDKFLSDPKLAKEVNPQLGLRAIRFCLKEVELFKTQLRAMVRASAFGNIRILFPMISGIEEILEAKKILSEVKEDLQTQGVPFQDPIEIGVMIEVPSAVIIADQLAREVDFFSIGTNDLIQYALAIDRVNERVAYLYEPLHLAVLRLIRHIVKIGHRAGIRVAMCGEMAGDPAYTMILLGLELDELSMNPLAIPRVKKIIRGSTVRESKALLKHVMSLSSAMDIREYVEHRMWERFPEEFQINEQ